MAGQLARRLAAVLLCVVALLTLRPESASAHVVPTSSVQLAVGEQSIAATVSIPLSDLEAASGITLADDTQTEAQAAVDDEPPRSRTTCSTTTGNYEQLQTTVVLAPPADDPDPTADLESFDLGYDAVVDKVATHVVIVTAEGTDGDMVAVGTVQRSTVTNEVVPLHVDLGSGSGYHGFLAMIRLGMRHIQEGTDHQLFLLTLLLPAPLLARRGRWAGAAGGRHAVRRIAAITGAFTLGHSVTLALGALGLPVPQGLVEAMIAVSILVAAAHAVRPIFPGREAVVAGAFGLIHGLAFSETLRALDLTGTRLVTALLGFNLGIEAMQLLVVALVLPPLLALAGHRGYRRLRVVAAAATAVAATGWLAARLGVANPVSDVADRLGTLALPVVALLWLVGLVAAGRSPVRSAPAGLPSAMPPDESQRAHSPSRPAGQPERA